MPLRCAKYSTSKIQQAHTYTEIFIPTKSVLFKLLIVISSENSKHLDGSQKLLYTYKGRLMLTYVFTDI